MPATRDRGSMVRAGIQCAYQLPRVTGGNLGTDVLCQEQNEAFSGQHHSSGIYKQCGGYCLQGAGSSSEGLVDVVPGEEYPYQSAAPPGGTELYSRCRISDNGRLHRLNPDIFMRIDTLMGPIEVDLFASRLTAQCPAYFSWRPDPYTIATDALVQDWTHIRGFANPPWVLIGRVLSHADPASSGDFADTNLESPALVPSSAGTSHIGYHSTFR